MFIPTTKEELKKLNWKTLDIILITGDSYIDSSFIGAAVIGKYLIKAGFKVGIIAQPDFKSDGDITRLGEPNLFWGVSGGSVDSMVANYTALKKKRRSDDFTPGGINNRRPDRAVIVYSNLIRKYFKNTKPIVLGGIEASLRRVAHYDYWSDKIRKPILFDAKAEYLVYGMAEKIILELARALRDNKPIENLKSLCYISNEPIDDYLTVPSFDNVVRSKTKFISMFKTFYDNNDYHTAKGLNQKIDTRYLIQNPPSDNLTQRELDSIYELGFEDAQHPFYEKGGEVKALETLKFSITATRGCYGECNFCSIAVHQGQTVQWRSEKSIVNEATMLAGRKDFKGYIKDVGGPTGNMYGFECAKKISKGVCNDKRCIFPDTCKLLKPNHKKQIELLRKLRKIKGIKKVFVASGIRHDLILEDKEYGRQYLKEIIKHHISGQLKIAPEHTEDKVLSKMGKPSEDSLIEFKKMYDELARDLNPNQFLSYYLIAAHPGCTQNEMDCLKKVTSEKLHINPRQVQVFTPLPSTYSALMYYTGIDPFSGEKIFVEKDLKRKKRQKEILFSRSKNRTKPKKY